MNKHSRTGARKSGSIIDDALNITLDGPPSSIADRELITLSGTAQDATWAPDTDIREIEVTVLSQLAGTPELNAAIAMVFDAPNDTVRDTWLAAGSHKNDDAQSVAIAVGETRRFPFAFGLTKASAKRIWGTEALTVKIKAGDLS